MKKILKVVAGVALAGCMLLPLAACSNTSDNSEEVKQLQQQVQDLQTEINSLKNGNGGNDLFTGSPKFNYGINETIPYYVNGNKIFDFKVTDFSYHFDALTVLEFTINYEPGYSSKNVAVVATLYDKSTGSLSTPYDSSNTDRIRFNMDTSTEKIITLFYGNIPFASITATPRAR